MATWSELQTLSNFDLLSVASNGNDLFFVQYGGELEYNVFKYDTSEDTVTQISNTSSWTGTTPLLGASFPGGLSGSCIQWFNGSLYAVVFTEDATDDLRIFKYNGSGTSWTEIETFTNPSGRFVLLATSSYLVLAASNQSSFLFDWAFYSSNGTLWATASVSDTPPQINDDFAVSKNRLSYNVTPTDKLIFSDDAFKIGGDEPRQGYRWFQWNPTSLNITHSTFYDSGEDEWTPADAWLHREGDVLSLVDIFIWFANAGVWKYTNSLGGTISTPGNHNQGGTEIFPAYSIGFTEQPGDLDGDFVLLSGGTWGTPEAVGTSAITHVIRMTDGGGFIFGFVGGSTSGIYGRSEPFPDINGETARFYWGENVFTQSKVIEVGSYQLYGVWSDGFIITYADYDFTDVVFGTHVGNFPHVVKGSYNGSTFNFTDLTHDLSYCLDETETYRQTYGATYAATYYKNTVCNVVALEWV
jgi:hypothetical protein